MHYKADKNIYMYTISILIIHVSRCMAVLWRTQTLKLYRLLRLLRVFRMFAFKGNIHVTDRWWNGINVEVLLQRQLPVTCQLIKPYSHQSLSSSINSDKKERELGCNFFVLDYNIHHMSPCKPFTINLILVVSVAKASDRCRRQLTALCPSTTNKITIHLTDWHRTWIYSSLKI